MLTHTLPLSAFGLLLACSPADPPPEPAQPRDTSSPVSPRPSPVPAPTPVVRPPAPPEGAASTNSAPWLYVERCRSADGCPQLFQPAAEKYCRSLRLGGHSTWRLPSKDEIPRFKALSSLDDLAGYHWSRSPYAEDHGQVWIVDPTGSPSTTIPRERKKMRTRCVMEP